MVYTTSQALIDILLKNGFRETTRKKYWEHYKLVRKNKTYSESVKRCFYLGGLTVFFDYIHIYILAKADYDDCGLEISEGKLRAIIYLAKSYRKRKEYDYLATAIKYSLIEYTNIKERPQLYSDKKSSRLVSNFEAVIL